MRRLASLVLAFVAVSCAAQTITPNIGLQVPAYNQLNYGTLLNYDLNKIDLLLSGNGLLPAINSSAYACAGSYGTSGEVLSTTGTACQWVANGGGSDYPGVTTDGAGGLNLSNLHASGSLFSQGIIYGNAGFFAETLSTANSGQNFAGPPTVTAGSTWNGSIPVLDEWTWQSAVGTGANPTTTYTLLHGGSLGAATVNAVFPWLIGSVLNGNGTLLPSTSHPPTGNTSGAVELTLTGTTGTVTGTALTATCDSGTASVTGAVVGRPVAVSSTTGADVGGAFDLRASVTSSGTVTVYVCGTGTPTSLAYNVTVL